MEEIADEQSVVSTLNETEQMIVLPESVMWPLLDEDKHGEHALEMRKESRRGEKDK